MDEQLDKPKNPRHRPKGSRDKKPRRKVRYVSRTRIVKIRDPKAPKKRIGKPPHEPTAQTRHTVRKLVVTGHFRQEHIADCLGIGVMTLRKYYGPELVKAKGEFATNIVSVMELKAVGGPPDPMTGMPNWREADSSLLKFLGERVCGMVPIHKLQHMGMLGVFDPSKLTDDEQRFIEPILAKLAGEGSVGSLAPGYGEEGDAEGEREP